MSKCGCTRKGESTRGESSEGGENPNPQTGSCGVILTEASHDIGVRTQFHPLGRKGGQRGGEDNKKEGEATDTHKIKIITGLDFAFQERLAAIAQ